MNTPASLTAALHALIENNQVSVDMILSPESVICHRLKVPAKVPEGAKLPIFYGPINGDESPEACLVKAVLTSYKEAYKLSDYLAEEVMLDPQVHEFFNDARAATPNFINNVPRYEAFAQPDNKVVEVYYISRRAAVEQRDLYLDLTMISPKPEDVEKLASLGFYEKVALVSAPAGDTPTAPLETAFSHTQNIDTSWSRNVNVVALDETRSSMVGDVMVVDGEAHVVSGFGFKKLENFEPGQAPATPARRKHMDVDGLDL
jgi:hypothetical protein